MGEEMPQVSSDSGLSAASATTGQALSRSIDMSDALAAP